MSLAAERVRSRHPFEFLFIALSIATSISVLAARQVRPGSLQEGVGTEGTVGWAILLLVGSLGALVGIYWRERATGLYLEAVGLFIAGLCTIFFAAAAVIVVGGAAVYPAVTLTGYGVAAIWRAGQINRLLRKVSKELAVPPEA